MNKKTLLSLMLLCFAFFGVVRAEVVELGDGGTTNNQYLPGYNYYNYSLTQQIYTACEIGTAGTINSIAFKNTGTEKTRTYNVYMLLTDKETFTNGSDWVAMSEADLVFSGSVTFTVDEWTTITLDTPFVLDGVYNLLVGVADVTGGYSSAPHMACLVYDAPSQAIRAYRDGGAYDITDPGVNGTVMDIKNQIQLDITPNPNVTVCCPITSLSVYEPELTAYQARLMWEGDADNYDLEYKKASDTEWSSTITIGGTQYLIQDLQQNTAYNARVRSNCGTGYSYWKTVNFTTLEACASPANVNVSETTAHGFTASFTPGDETQEMWFYYWSTSNETPTTQNYGTAMATTFTIEYNANLNAETTYYLWIGVQCGEEFNWSDPATFTTAVACLAPTDLTVTLTPGDGTVASLAWTENGTATSWDVYLSTDAEFSEYTSIQVDNVPSVELTDLIPETTYYARVNAFCEGEGTSSYSNVVSFTPTNAYTLTVNDGTTTNSYVPVYGTWVDSYTKCQFIIPAADLADMQWGTISKMTFYSNTENKTWGAAEFDILLAEVDNTTFESATLVDWDGMELVYQGAVSVSNNKMEIVFDNDYQYTGGNLLVGFHQTVKGTYSSINWYGVSSTNSAIGGYESNAKSLNVQNFLPKTTFDYVPGEAPSCLRPTDLTVSDITAHTAELSWTAGGDETAWEVEVTGEYASTWDVTEPSFSLVGLDPEADYSVKVRAVCGEENFSDWSIPANFTTPVACPAPTGLAVTYEGGTTATLAWTENGTATEWDVEYGTDEEFNAYTTVNVSENPSTELTGLDLATTYYVRVKTYCGSEGYSTYSNTVDFTTDLCLADNMCAITIALTDSYGDGWNGGQLSVVDVLTENVLGTYTISSGSSANYTLNVCDGRDINIVYTAGNYSTENGWVVTDINGEVICEHEGCNNGCTPTTGIQATYTVNCAPPTCLKPTDLTVNYTGGATAIVTWEGEAETYNIDVNGEVTEGVTSPYTLEDLAPATDYAVMVQADCGSDGTSDWTDAVSFTGLTPAPTLPTDVEVTPSVTTGEVAWVAGENNGSWNLRWRPYVDPALAPTVWDLPLDGYEEQLVGWLAYDADGDGNVWGLAYSNSAQDDLCFYSASWTSGTGSLTPDNWLITPEVALGGTLKFDTWNYMSSYPEKIMVYVCSNPAFESLDEFVAISAFIQPGTAHETIELSLSEFTGTGRIAFRHYDCEDKYQIFVDNIKVFPENGVEIPEWTVVENVESPYTIEGLTPSTEYEVQVKAFNEEGDGMTDWTESVVFTTLDAPTFTKDIVGYGEGEGNYYLIASPIGTVAATAVENLIYNEYDFFAFDQSTPGAEWRNYKGDEETGYEGGFDLAMGEGYLYANSEDVTLTFVGIPVEDENYDVVLDYDADAIWKGWNLVGNPFAEIAYLVGDYAFYTMNADGSDFEATTSTSIEPMEGIFVIAENDGETLTFTTNAPETKGANLALNLSQGRGVIDRAIVRFSEGRQLPKLQLNPNHTKVYIPMDGEDYAVVRSEDMGELPVNFKAEHNGTYMLSFTEEEVAFNYLHLIDNLTGADVDLLVNPSYSFEANTTDYASRFRLVFATGNAEDNFAFYSNGSFVISNEGEAVLQVVDVTGRILSSENISGSASVNVKAAAGVYMLRLVNGDNVKVQKVVID